MGQKGTRHFMNDKKTWEWLAQHAITLEESFPDNLRRLATGYKKSRAFAV